MNDLNEVITKIKKFRDDRDWEQFHNSKDLALAISIESAELLELFLWKENEDVDQEKLKEELADIVTFCLLLSDKHGLNMKQIILEKLTQNEAKYPISKAKGTAKKYTDL